MATQVWSSSNATACVGLFVKFRNGRNPVMQVWWFVQAEVGQCSGKDIAADTYLSVTLGHNHHHTMSIMQWWMQ